MRLSTLLLILLILVVTTLVSNGQPIKGTLSQYSTTLIKPSGIHYKIVLNPILLSDSLRALTPKEIFFIFYPRVSKDNYDCWSSWFPNTCLACNSVDIKVLNCEYTFEEFKDYLFN